jgi:CubicO group peptidase (beta-lactamase class C family)
MTNKWFLALLLGSACVSALAADAPLPTLPQVYSGAMLPNEAVRALSHTEQLLPVRIVHRAGAVQSLRARGAAFPAIQFEDKGIKLDLYDYLAVNRVAGILVLKNGEVALEHYDLGATPQTRWSSWSLAKSITSTLTGAAIADGLIKNLDEPVTRYVPALRGGAYEGVTIRHILTMSSGVKWNETYTDPTSDRRQLLQRQIAQQPGELLKFMNSRSRAAPPGTVLNYNTGETVVLGAVIEGATHRPLAEYLSEKIWSKAGMEQDATWWVESPNGLGVAGTGLAATLRDYGRFGLVAAADGKVGGASILPAGWFDEAGTAKVIGGKRVDYGYMWWVPEGKDILAKGAFEGEGIFGQFIYINRREHLVIIVLSARSKPSPDFQADDGAFFEAVTRALH